MLAQHASGRPLLIAALLLVGCGDDAFTVDAAVAAPDAASPRHHDAGPPEHRNTGAAAPPFMPAAPPAPIPAFNDHPVPDAAAPDAMIANDGGPVVEPHDGCIALAAGAGLRIAGELSDEQRWLRIDPEGGCPAARVSADDVAFASYVICEAGADRVVSLSMLGTDQLPIEDAGTVADPLLVAYADQSALQDDPFDCLAANDDGVFDGFVSNSSRIEAFALPAGMPLVVVASSMEPPAQHGTGHFALELSAQ